MAEKKQNIWARGSQRSDDNRKSDKPKDPKDKWKRDDVLDDDVPKKDKWKRDDVPDDDVPLQAAPPTEPGTDAEILEVHGMDLQDEKNDTVELEPTWYRTIAAAFASWLLMVAFATAQGAIIFADEPNWPNIAMAMNMNLLSAGVMGMIVAVKSKVPIFIAGPDLTSCIIIGDCVSKISNHVAAKLDMGVPVPGIVQSSPTPSPPSRRLHELQDYGSAAYYFGEEPLNEWWKDIEQSVLGGLGLNSWNQQDLFGFSLASSAAKLEDTPDDSASNSGGAEYGDLNEALDDHASDSGDAEEDGSGDSSYRRLGEQSGTDQNTTDFPMPTMDSSKFCAGGHLEAYPDLCEKYHKGVRCTTVLLCMAVSLMTGIVLLLLGHLHICRFVEFVPRGISDAFSACVGIKTFTAAIKICLMMPKLFLPAMLAGVPMYFVLARRMGNPAFTMPLFIIGTTILQVGYMQHGGYVKAARAEGIFLPVVPNEMPWNTYQDLTTVEYLHWQACKEVYPEMLALVVVIVLDSLAIGLRKTEDFTPIRIYTDFETMLAGIGNLAIAPFAGIPGFVQFRLSLCNYGTQLNVQDRYAGMLYAALCVASALAPKKQLLWQVPRNIFAVVLFCGGAGYIAEHLWGSRKYLSFAEWSQIIVILVVFASWDSLPYALVLGGFLTGVQFICKYAKVPCIDGVPMHGGELASRERHSPLMFRALNHIANHWVLIIKLQGFVFFSAVALVSVHIRDIIKKQEDDKIPDFRRLKYVIIDCAELNGMDCSASKELETLRAEANTHGAAVLWSSMQPEMLDDLIMRGAIASEDDAFYDVYEAMLYVEQHIRVFRNKIEERWLSLHPMFKQTQELIRLRENFEPFRFIFQFDAARFGCPWMYCSKRTIKAFKTVLWEDAMHEQDLFLVHTGAVGIFKTMPKDSEQWTPPEVIYKHGWFLNRQFLFRELTDMNAIAMEDGEVLCWNTHQWFKMVRERPLMASAIMEAAMRQMSFDCSVVSSLLALHTKLDVDDEGEIDLSHMDLATCELKSPHDVPHDLSHNIAGLEAAQFLKEFKLYEPIEADSVATALPEIPKKIRDDLAIAFWTYAVEDANGWFVLPVHKVKEALMYAGIFNMLAANVAEHALDEKEFIAVGHETALTRLSKKQVSKIYNIFKSYDKDKSGHLNRDEIIVVFRETFHPNISEDEVNGICGAWDDDGSGQIDAKEFVGILSRFIRKHEADWNLLLGFRELLKKGKKEKITSKDQLTVDHLINNKHSKLTQEEAEEMLWACDCFDLKGDGKELNLPGFVAAVVLDTEYKFGRLPPKPKKPPLKGQWAPQEVDDGRELKKLNGKYKKKKKRKSEANGVSADDPEEDDNADSHMDGTNHANHADKLERDAATLPATRMLKNGIMPFRQKGKHAELPTDCLAKMRTMLEYPQSSRCAQIYMVFMVLLILLSVGKPSIQIIQEAISPTVRCPKDYPYAYYSGLSWCCKVNWEKNSTKGGRSCDGSKFHVGKMLSKCCKGDVQVKCRSPPCANYDTPASSSADAVTTAICVVFTVEYFVRLLICNAHRDETFIMFLINPMNLCDLGSILPFWIAFATGSGDSTFYRMMRIPRVFKVSQNAKLQKVGKRAGIFVPVMVVNFVIMGAYYREYNAQHSKT